MIIAHCTEAVSCWFWLWSVEYIK